MWSEGILDELRRNLLRYGIAESGVDRRIQLMVEHFPEAMVTGYQTLTDSMTNHPKDRHVLAAAVCGSVEPIVTQNTRDFPVGSTKPFNIEAVNQDTFLLDQFDLDPVAVRQALHRQVSRYRRQPRTVDDLLVALGGPGNGCPNFTTNYRGSDEAN